MENGMGSACTRFALRMGRATAACRGSSHAYLQRDEKEPLDSLTPCDGAMAPQHGVTPKN